MKIKLHVSFIIAFLILSFNVKSFAGDYNYFPDIKDHWASESVNFLVQKKIISGREDGLFHPNEKVYANEYIKMVVTALGYTDIQNFPGDWARNYINKAYELELVYPGEIENFYQPINRGMMAKIAMRALKDETVPDYIMAYKGLVTDYADIDANIRLDVLKCIEKGIIKGMPDGSFRPEYYSTRAEAATVIHRMISEKEREKSKPVFAEPDPEFEAFMASDVAANYCSVEFIDRVVDGKVIFGGMYQVETGELLLPVYYNPDANKEVYETLRNLVMYAKEYGHFVRIFLSSDGGNVFIDYYENNKYPFGPNWYRTYNFELVLRAYPYKYVDELREYTYYTWITGNFVMDKTEDWAAVNYREPEITKAFEIALKSIYGNDLGKKFFNFAISEYDNERESWFVYGEDYSNFFLEYREDLGGLEVYNNNGSVKSMAVLFCTNKLLNK